MKLINIFTGLLLVISISVNAADDQALKLKKVATNAWAIVGPLTNRTAENLGNNANFGFIVTKEGVVLIDAGGSYQGAKRIHQIIQSVTKQPVKFVINSGGQDHRWFGNDYFSHLGAKIISSAAAKKDHQARSAAQWTMLSNLIGNKGIAGTKEKFADITFKSDYKFTLGEVTFEIYHKGPAHTPGDAYIWLPQSKVMFTGDIVYTERMLGIIEVSNSRSWLNVFDAMAAHKPDYVVPGHGYPTTLAVATKDTRDYLAFLRKTIAAFIEQGGGAHEISRINQSRFQYLANYDTLHGRNALKVYTELEWE